MTITAALRRIHYTPAETAVSNTGPKCTALQLPSSKSAAAESVRLRCRCQSSVRWLLMYRLEMQTSSIYEDTVCPSPPRLHCCRKACHESCLSVGVPYTQLSRSGLLGLQTSQSFSCRLKIIQTASIISVLRYLLPLEDQCLHCTVVILFCKHFYSRRRQSRE